MTTLRSATRHSVTRRFSLAASAALLAMAVSMPAQAQAPMELKIIAPAAPGGGWDQTARAMQQALVAAGLAKSVQVVNVPGAGGSVGIAQFATGAKGDGKQLMVNGFVMVGALLTNKSPVTLDQVTPIARLTEETQVIVVPANSPIKNAKDLAAAVKTDVAKVTWAGGSAGGTDHITAALFAKAAGADATKVNYIPFSGGGESLAAVLGGKVTAGISGYGEYEGQIKAGKLRAIGLTAPERIPGLDVPTFKEQGFDVVITNWRSVMAPPGITPEQRAALVDLVGKMVKSPAWTEILKQKGWDDAYLPGDGFAAFLKTEQTRVRDILTTIGLVKS
ncbi:MAG: C4-dicarboxylate transporter substrate-binding protein [Xanthobacteraceae bacterium]|nr:C4-dicarboxylate transporter substrate-binding protein [Xanthobacteraceae bacterium]